VTDDLLEMSPADTTATAGRYAQELLSSLGVPRDVTSRHDPYVDWANSGAMALTGHPSGPPLAVAGPAVVLRGVLLALEALEVPGRLPGLELMSERAAIIGLSRRGATSCGGATRLLSTADGQVAVTLARHEDLELLEALTGLAPSADPWADLGSWLSGQLTASAVARMLMLGVPFGAKNESTAAQPWTVTDLNGGASEPQEKARRPVVVNLSSLWAGPLAASLLGSWGCRVIKVEHTGRPDGTRSGPAELFELLNGDADLVQLDFATTAGRSALVTLLCQADIVIEGSRARALRQLGVDADAIAQSSTHLTWVSITGHGRSSNRVAFGDDAAVAGGLVAEGCFIADAVCDPLTGAHAALAAWSGLLTGGRRMIDLAMSQVAASAVAWEPTHPPPRAVLEHGRWMLPVSDARVAVADPRRR
jgi:hypothetical protein